MRVLTYHAVVVIFLFLINCARATSQDEERAILIQLYDSTNGQYWLRSNNWLLNNISACDWAGISCIDGFVVRLDLQSNQLTGTLPESIGNLLMLDTINLEGNHLSGTLPESIKKLTRLERLWLGGNQFSGTIPTWINNLTNLYYLYLTANQFTGTIPDFSGLPRLQHLYLNNNQLEGTVPATLAANTYLDTIFLVGNKLTGSIPAELGQLTRLQHVQLGRNELSGKIPESIYQITSLGLFSIAHNKISGTISNKISQLQNLLGFDFGYNQISGTIPESIGELKALVRFEAFANNLTGTIPKSVMQLTRLTQLLVSDNQLTGTIPDNIGNMVNLTHFYLSRNKLSGTLPNSITNLRNLIWLQISNNELTGTIPNNLGQLTLLQQLHLNTNKFSGTIPASIGQLSMLQRFEGYSNLLEGPIPDTIGNLKRLMALNLVYNNLTGTLPQSMGGMSSLLTFAVSHNRISGVIPESFGTFQSMNGLFLNNNNLIGTIPRALGRNRMLSHLMLGGNRLTGPLPQFESNDLPARLQYFTANDNQLTGSVPLTYALLNNLRHVNFANNQLTGSVLHLFDLTDTISEIFLSNNKFVGTIPPGLTTRVLLKSLFIDNNQFSGTIPESFGRLISLEQVQFAKNAFTGTLPATLSRLFRLQELHVANNDLTGTIPIELFELPLAELDLSNNNLNGTIAHAITSMQLLRKIDISSNWFTGTLPAMNNMRTLQQIHLHDNLFRGCLSLPSSFKSESSKCSLDGNSFCCSTEEFNCYDAVCPAKSTLYVYSGSTLSLSNIHNLAAFHNLIVEPNAKLVVRNKDALVVDCMQFEGEIVFDMTESEAETPVFYITTTCGGSDIDSMTKISSVGRGCYSSSIRSVAKTLAFTLSCPKEKTSLALVVGISVPLGILFIAAMVLFIVTMNARRKREEQLKSRVEMLTLSSSHVKNHSAPPEEFKFKLPDDLPIKISKTSFKFGTRGDLLIVDRPVRDSFTVSLRKSKAISVGSLYDKLVQHRTVVQIRPITSSKYDLVATPQVFEVPEGGSTDVELVLTMKMTTKCQVSFWIELPEEEVYSLIEFDAASEHSPWIDVDEVQVEGDAIGEGGFGAVYKAMYRGQRVAFKTLKMQDLGDEVTHEFEQEVRMMMNLHHKSIVQFIGASRVSGKRAILTEFITNGDLKHLLQKQQLDMKFKLKLALDIAEALKFLHLNNILHRDIKPENALVVSTSKDAIVNVKLADFGTARSVSDSVTSKFTKGVGTPIYMAVEILKNESYARNADIYSFGVLLWAIMTQDEPYKEFKYSWDVAEFVLQGKRLPVPQDCPHQIGQLISHCWAQDPNDRPLIDDVVKTIETVYLSTK